MAIAIFCKNKGKVLYVEADLKEGDWVIDTLMNVYAVTDVNPQHKPDTIGNLPGSWVVVTKDYRDASKKNANFH